MGLTTRPVVNFSGGEASPEVKGRIDVKQYYALAETIENNLVSQYGGTKRLPGTKYVQRTKDVSKATRLIPFIFSSGDSYMLEFGNLYIRVFQDGESVLDTAVNISGATQADPCVITTSTAHGYSNDDVVEISSVSGMTELNGIRYVIDNVTSNTFEIKDEDGNDIDSTGYTAYTSGGTSEKVYDIATAYSSEDLADLKYVQQADIMYLFHKDYPVRKLSRFSDTSWTFTTITYDTTIFPPFLGVNTSATTLTASGTTGSVTITASTDTFTSDHVGAYFRMDVGSNPDGYVYITAYGSATSVTATVVSTLGGTGATTDWYEGAWSDYQGYPADGKIYEQRLYAVGTTRKPLGVWASKPGEYENFWRPSIGEDTADDDGLYYTIGSSQVDRILWAYPTGVLNLGTAGGPFILSSGSDALPVTPTNVSVKQQNENGSSSISPIRSGLSIYYIERSGEILGQFRYTLDYDSYETDDVTYLNNHILDSGVVDMAIQNYPYTIVWCVRDDGVVATLAREDKNNVIGWSRQVFAGTNAEVESVGVIPNGSEDQVWFVVKRDINGSTVRYVEYLMPHEFDDQHDAYYVQSGITYDVPITISGATQAEPVVVTATAHGLSNGDKVRITDVVGMTELNNNYYYVANKDANTFELTNSSGTDIDGTAYTAYVSGGEARLCVGTLSGLEHLEGESVSILTDGATHPNKTVSSGSVTLEGTYGLIHAGLGYTSTLKTMDIEAGSQTGTAQGRPRSISRCMVRFFESLGGTLGNGTTQDTIPSRDWGDQYGDAPALFTGDKELQFPSGHETNKYVVVKQEQPLPQNILGIFPRMLVAD